MQNFPCKQCGLCCQRVHLASETQFLDRGDGTCRHYDAATRGCTVYAERPDICQVAKQYALHYSKLYSWNEFVTLNLQVCDLLKHQENTP